MDITELEQLVKLVEKSNIRELTLRQGEARLTLKKPAMEETVRGGALIPYPGGVEIESRFGAEESSNQLPYAANVEEHSLVTAPLVGVFHHVKPLVGLGARVKSGQVIAVIEAMKLMTEVTAPTDGIIVETLIEDGMPAEYGQVLFAVKAEPQSEQMGQTKSLKTVADV